jgi:hypothetical protein
MLGRRGSLRRASSFQGSFDCVALRFADGNFAQDDNIESSMSMFSTVRSYVLWQHERGTLHYDIMVTLILIFIFVSPRVINFNDKPAAPDLHRTGVVVSSDGGGTLVYEIEASQINAADDTAIRNQLLAIIEPISGSASIIKYQKISDGGRQEYQVWVKRNP